MIFTIDVDGKPTVAFEVKNLREAAELSREEWFRADLSTLSSNGEPLCRIESKLKARLATAPERDVYEEAAKQTTEF